MYNKERILEKPQEEINVAFQQNTAIGTECIYNLVPHRLYGFAETKGAQKNRSQKSVKSKKKSEVKTWGHKTMGEPPNYCNSPKEKHTFLKKAKPIKYDSYRLKTKTGIWPTCTTHKAVFKHKEVNFLDKNISDINNKDKVNRSQLNRIFVDDRNGSRFPHINKRTTSGLEVIYAQKRGFGRIPEYLLKIKEAKQETRKFEELYNIDENQRNSDRLMNEEERQQILDGLKCNWDKCNKKYQSLSIVMPSTSSSIKRKADIENEMSQLEQYISMLNQYDKIVVESKPKYRITDYCMRMLKDKVN